MMQNLPLLRLTGDLEQQGFAHGQKAATLVHRNWAVYRARFRREAGLDDAEIERRAKLWSGRMAARYPNYARAMTAVARGAGLPALAVVALNMRYELLYSAFAKQGSAREECTVAAVTPERSRRRSTLLVQNWDWIPEVELLWVLYKDGDVDVLAVTEAGVVGPKIGLNSAGVAVAVTGLVSASDRWDGAGTPFHVRCQRTFAARSLSEAAASAESEASPCSSAFLLADPDTALTVELSPKGTARVHPDDDVLVHANHFLASSELGVRQPLGDERRSTFHRCRRLRAALCSRRGWDETSLVEPLKDHDGYPDSVCRHPIPELPPEVRYATALSVVLDPRRGRLLYARGTPCRAPFRALELPAR